MPVSSSTPFDSTVAPASIQNVSHPHMAGSKISDDMTRKGMSCTIEWWITFLEGVFGTIGRSIISVKADICSVAQPLADLYNEAAWRWSDSLVDFGE